MNLDQWIAAINRVDRFMDDDAAIDAFVESLDEAPLRTITAQFVDEDCGCTYCFGYNGEIDNCGYVGKPLCICACDCPDDPA